MFQKELRTNEIENKTDEIKKQQEKKLEKKI